MNSTSFPLVVVCSLGGIFPRQAFFTRLFFLVICTAGQLACSSSGKCREPAGKRSGSRDALSTRLFNFPSRDFSELVCPSTVSLRSSVTLPYKVHQGTVVVAISLRRERVTGSESSPNVNESSQLKQHSFSMRAESNSH